MIILGAYQFGCGNRHGPAEVMPAPVRQRRIEVFATDGVGMISGGLRSRRIPIRCTYAGWPSRAALNVQLALDEGQKTDRGLYLLNVDGATFGNVVFQGLRAGEIFRDGATGLWVAINCVLYFESMLA